jgi:GNAT superfamily N-acetyltransferase
VLKKKTGLSMWNIREHYSPSASDPLLEGLYREAFRAKGLGRCEPFGLFVYGADDSTVAGTSGWSYYGCLYIDLLWVCPSLRGQKLGSALVQRAEEIGRKRRCTFSTVNTMDWEALPFYQKLGYAVEFEREGYDKGSRLYFLRKSL